MSKILNLTIRALHRKDCDIICNSTDKIQTEVIPKIAEKLGVSPDVIKTNLASIYEKLNNSARGLSKTAVNK